MQRQVTLLNLTKEQDLVAMKYQEGEIFVRNSYNPKIYADKFIYKILQNQNMI